jgi:predicted dehydrogenase
MKKYHLGIVGAGPWAKNYVRAFEKFPNIELVMLGRRKNIRPDFIPNKCLFFTDKNLYSSVRGLDGMIIATDSPCLPTIVCMSQNIAVMAEKPLLTNMNQIPALATCATNENLLVNYIHLFSDPFCELKKIVGNNKIIRICSSGFGPSKTREHFSPLWDYGPHDLSMVLSLMSSEPTEVDIQTHNKTKAGHSFRINLSFDGIKTKSIVGNGTITKSRYLSVTYTENGNENFITYDDMIPGKLFLNGKSINYPITASPLENSITSFLDLIDGKNDPRHGVELTTKITKILSTYED